MKRNSFRIFNCKGSESVGIPLRFRIFRFTLFVTLLLLATACSLVLEPDRTPEQATGKTGHNLVHANQFMVATANPYASRAAYQILKKGGNAVDAAISATMVLTLVEPQSSGLGGGCFILSWDQTQQKLHSFDGRETAPSQVDENLFMDQDRPLDFLTAVAGGRAVGVPGQLQSLSLLHQKHGKLPWTDLFTEAISLAKKGFEVSARLNSLLNNRVNREKLQRNRNAFNYFYPEGSTVKVGETLKNPQLASTLRRLAASGSSDFYHGDIGRNIVSAVQQDPAPGSLTVEDLAHYQAKERKPVCAPYRNHQICGMGPPSSGGISLLQMLKLLEGTDIHRLEPAEPQTIHLFAQAGRLAFADRNHYLADSDFIRVPVTGLLNQDYLQQRAELINPQQDAGKAAAGVPPGAGPEPFLNGQNPEQPGTSHLSIVDSAGNAVAITASIEQAFGSGIMTGGFLLNNELTDFSFRAKDQTGNLIANRVQGGKRPRSSMAPSMVFDEQQKLKMVLGSPGGSRIIPYVAQTLIGVLDWNLSIQEAINQPHYLHRNGSYLDLEKGTTLENLAPDLEKIGYQVNITDLNSGLQAIVVGSKGLEGGSDPRREGLVLGK